MVSLQQIFPLERKGLGPREQTTHKGLREPQVPEALCYAPRGLTGSWVSPAWSGGASLEAPWPHEAACSQRDHAQVPASSPFQCPAFPSLVNPLSKMAAPDKVTMTSTRPCSMANSPSSLHTTGSSIPYGSAFTSRCCCHNHLNLIKATQLLLYSSGSQKSDISLNGLKSKWRQGCITSWRL